jgi:hypothetical protein
VLSDILQKNPDQPLNVFVVWFAVLGPDSPSRVDPSLLDDPRAIHFWDSDGAVSASFSENAEEVGLPDDDLLWDAYLLFDGGTEWTEIPPPVVGWGAPVVTAIEELTAQLNDQWTDA